MPLLPFFAWAACSKESRTNSDAQQETTPSAAAAPIGGGDEPPPSPEAALTCCNLDPHNVIRDPGFLSIVPANLYTVPNTLAPCNNLMLFTQPAHNPDWFASPYYGLNGIYNTPQVPVNNCNALQLIAGGCDNGSISFWGNQITGESISQDGLLLNLNHAYKIKFNARLRPGSVGNAGIAMRFSNQVPSGSTDVRVIPPGSTLNFGNNSAPVRSGIITNTNWQCYTMSAPLVADLPYNTLHVYPVNNQTANGSWAIIEIDNIQVY